MGGSDRSEEERGAHRAAARGKLREDRVGESRRGRAVRLGARRDVGRGAAGSRRVCVAAKLFLRLGSGRGLLSRGAARLVAVRTCDAA